MDFIEYLQQHLLNLSLFGVVVLVWLVLNNWINKNLERAPPSASCFFKQTI